MTETKQTSTTKTDRRPDCVTEIRMGNSVLTVSGFFKQGAPVRFTGSNFRKETAQEKLERLKQLMKQRKESL